jgi:hypothetical protein
MTAEEAALRLTSKADQFVVPAAYTTDAHFPFLSTIVTLSAEIINHCVWLYFRFQLRYRDIEEMLAMRGVTLSYETIREWCLKFGQTYANGLRHKSPRPGRPMAFR